MNKKFLFLILNACILSIPLDASDNTLFENSPKSNKRDLAIAHILLDLSNSTDLTKLPSMNNPTEVQAKKNDKEKIKRQKVKFVPANDLSEDNNNFIFNEPLFRHVNILKSKDTNIQDTKIIAPTLGQSDAMLESKTIATEKSVDTSLKSTSESIKNAIIEEVWRNKKIIEQRSKYTKFRSIPVNITPITQTEKAVRVMPIILSNYNKPYNNNAHLNALIQQNSATVKKTS